MRVISAYTAYPAYPWKKPRTSSNQSHLLTYTDVSKLNIKGTEEVVKCRLYGVKTGYEAELTVKPDSH